MATAIDELLVVVLVVVGAGLVLAAVVLVVESPAVGPTGWLSDWAPRASASPGGAGAWVASGRLGGADASRMPGMAVVRFAAGVVTAGAAAVTPARAATARMTGTWMGATALDEPTAGATTGATCGPVALAESSGVAAGALQAARASVAATASVVASCLIPPPIDRDQPQGTHGSPAAEVRRGNRGKRSREAGSAEHAPHLRVSPTARET